MPLVQNKHIRHPAFRKMISHRSPRDSPADDHNLCFHLRSFTTETRRHREKTGNENPVSKFLLCASVSLWFKFYFANTCEKSLNPLNSNAFPLGSKKNIVACSPTSPAKRILGSMTNSTPFDLR